MTYIKPPAPNKCTWRSGPPPEVGWWPASAFNAPDCLRWWDGTKWSQPASVELSAKDAAIKANSPTNISGPLMSIQWTDRWWLK